MKHSVPATVGAMVLFLALLFPGQPMALAQPVVVADYAWTSKVVALEPTDRLPAQVSPQSLSLWLRIEGGAKALQVLQERGMLPIRCRWIHYAGTRISFETGKLIDEIKLGVGTRELVNKLLLEVRNKPDHNFDWRTWSTKNRARYGDWRVEMVYSDPARTPMLCRSQEGGGLIPCRFEISIR
ncbi:hypothetical protein [Desulfobulbus propionicus]|jgi:hypothetical protein